MIDDAGRVDVGRWGTDVSSTPRTRTVRQNLEMIVQNGTPVAGLDTNDTNAWGGTNSQLQFTWRSGLGVDARRHLIYVAADGVDLSDLAHSMAAAGITRGMELDIHPQPVTFMSYWSSRPQSGNKVLPAMRPAITRYLVPNQRDFLAVTT